MTPLNKIKASTKLYLLAFVMCVFIAGIGLYGIYEVKKMNQNTQTLYADRVLPIEQLTSVRFDYAVGILSSAQEVNSHSGNYGKALEQIRKAENNIAVNWKAYMRTY